MTTLYKKVISKKGRITYIPVKEYDPEFCDSLPEGTTIVEVMPGSTSRIYRVKPDYLTVLSVLAKCRHEICSEILKYSETKPSRTKLTPKQMELWEELKTELGDYSFYLTYPSANDIVDSLEESVMKRSKDLLDKHPALKKAWENFQLLLSMVE
jgi:hypothetical protein